MQESMSQIWDMTTPTGHAVTSFAWAFLSLIHVSHGCGAMGGTCGATGAGSSKADYSVDGKVWHKSGADFDLCEADVREDLYHGNICFKYSDAQDNNFCMLDNSHVYYWEAIRDDPNAWIESRPHKSPVEK